MVNSAFRTRWLAGLKVISKYSTNHLQAHKISQGYDNKKRYLLLNRPPQVIYAPSTVVNHNGINMEGNYHQVRKMLNQNMKSHTPGQLINIKVYSMITTPG